MIGKPSISFFFHFREHMPNQADPDFRFWPFGFCIENDPDKEIQVSVVIDLRTNVDVNYPKILELIGDNGLDNLFSAYQCSWSSTL